MSKKAKSTVYVSGLEASVTEEVLYAAFIPFGDIKAIQIPKQHVDNKSRMYGFVEFENEQDCKAALENMHGAELYGHFLSCSVAKPQQQQQQFRNAAVWSNEDFIKSKILNEGDSENEMDEE